MLHKYLVAFAILLMAYTSPSAAQLFGPLPYTKSADTPAGFSDGPMNVENFEDGVIAPDLTIRGSIVTPSNVTDSVDYDDGVLDGFGRAGHSLQNSGLVRVEFLTRTNAAGLVWTDGAGQVTFEAFGLQGQSLGLSGPHVLADGNTMGGTAEDRFFGVNNPAGISAIEVRASGGIEIDHVQWQVADTLVGNTASFSVPNASFLNGAAVVDLQRLSDGKYLIAGSFERLGSVEKPALAKLNADGSLDAGFSQNSFSPGFSLLTLVDASGRIYVTDGAKLLRLNPDGSRDNGFAQVNFNPTFARAMALVSDGLIVGGSFTTITGGPARNGLVKLRFDGSIDASFTLSAPGTRVLASLGSDQLLIGGSFASLGGFARAGIAKINSGGAGSVVLDWNANLGGASVTVTSLALDAAFVYVSGLFVTNATSSNLAKLALVNGAIDNSWNVSLGSNTGAPSIRLINGSIFVSVPFDVGFSNPPAAAVSRRVAKLNSLTGSLDAAFNPAFNGLGQIRLAQANGARLMAGGSFISVNGLARSGLAQLNANGSTDTVIVPVSATETGFVTQVAFDETNNRSYAIGDFSMVNGLPIANFARLSNGVLDTVWRPAVSTDRFSEFVVRPDGIWVSHFGGISRLNDTDGGIVPGWSNTSGVGAMTSSAQALYISNSGGLQRLIFAGNGSADPACVGAGRSFEEMEFDALSNSIVGKPSASVTLQKVDANSCALSAGFTTPSLNSTIGRFALDGKGGIWISGNFNEIGAQPRRSPARLLLASGALDANVLPTVGNTFNFALGYHRGFLYGARVSSGGDTVILRMPDAGGATDISWKIAAQQGFTESIAFGSDRAIVGGEFSGIAGASRSGVAALPLHDRLLRSGFE